MPSGAISKAGSKPIGSAELNGKRGATDGGQGCCCGDEVIPECDGAPDNPNLFDVYALTITGMQFSDPSYEIKDCDGNTLAWMVAVPGVDPTYGTGILEDLTIEFHSDVPPADTTSIINDFLPPYYIPEDGLACFWRWNAGSNPPIDLQFNFYSDAGLTNLIGSSGSGVFGMAYRMAHLGNLGWRVQLCTDKLQIDGGFVAPPGLFITLRLNLFLAWIPDNDGTLGPAGSNQITALESPGNSGNAYLGLPGSTPHDETADTEGVTDVKCVDFIVANIPCGGSVAVAGYNL